MSKRTDDRVMRDGVKRRCRPECPPRACPNPRHTWAYVVTEPAPGGGRGRKVWRGGYASERDARAARRAVLVELDRGVWVRPAVDTVASVAQRWLRALDAGGEHKPATVAGYAKDLRLCILPALGGKPVGKVTAADLAALYATLTTDRGLASATVRRVHATASGLLAAAVAWGLRADNPARRAKVPGARRAGQVAQVPPDKAWTEADLSRFLASVAGRHDAVLWHVAAATGMRRGELAALRWDDVDLRSGRVTVCRQAGRVRRLDGRWETVEGSPKSGRSRVVTLDAGTVAMLAEHQRRQRSDPVVPLADRRDAGGRVFRSTVGTPLSDYTINATFVRRVAAVPGLPPISVHGLRHSHATILLGHGTPLAVVAQRLGDTVAVIERAYSHWLPSADEAAAATWATAMRR